MPHTGSAQFVLVDAAPTTTVSERAVDGHSGDRLDAYVLGSSQAVVFLESHDPNVAGVARETLHEGNDVGAEGTAGSEDLDGSRIGHRSTDVWRKKSMDAFSCTGCSMIQRFAAFSHCYILPHICLKKTGLRSNVPLPTAFINVPDPLQNDVEVPAGLNESVEGAKQSIVEGRSLHHRHVPRPLDPAKDRLRKCAGPCRAQQKSGRFGRRVRPK